MLCQLEYNACVLIVSGISTENSSSRSPFSWRTDIIGIIGVTLLVAVLLWPTLDGSRTLMSDSWRMSYPWAVEETVDAAALSDALGNSEIEPSRVKEPYVLAYDIYLEFLPWYAFAKSEVLAGRWPHWNPHAFCGAPLYANHLVPLTHPPLILAILTAPVQQIHTVATFLTWWIASLGLYLYLRSKRLQPIAGLTAVALYLTCGHYMPLVPFQMAGLMYYPWLMWSSDALDERPSFRALSAFALILGLMLAAGYPAYVVPFLYMIALYRILMWIYQRKPRSWWAPRIGIFVLAFILGALVSAVQNYPTWSNLENTSRGVTDQEERTLYEDIVLESNLSRDIGKPVEYASSRLAKLAAPIFQRQIELQHPYVGIPLVLLAVLGLIFIRPPPYRRAMLVLAIFFTILAAPPVFKAIGMYIPGLWIAPYPPYATAQFLLVILAGFGINELLFQINDAGKTMRLALTGLTTACLIVFAWSFIPNALIQPDTSWEREQIPLAVVVLITGILAIVFPVLSLIFGRKIPFIGGFLLPLVITLAGITGHFYQYPVFQKVPVMPLTPSIRALPQSSEYRVIRHSSKPLCYAPSLEDPLTFGGNLPMWAGVMDSQGYDSFILEGQWSIIETLAPDSLFNYGFTFPLIEPNALSSPLLDAMAVKYVISDDPGLLTKPEVDLPESEWKLLHTGGLIIYERTNALPRWYLSDEPTFADNLDEALQIMSETGLFHSHEGGSRTPGVVIESRDGNAIGVDQEANNSDSRIYPPGKISLVDENPQRLEFRIEADRECFLVLADAWHPEWIACLDDEVVQVLRANGAYRAIAVPTGDHRVVFRYEPNAFRTGTWITVAALTLLFLCSIIELMRGIRSAYRRR